MVAIKFSLFGLSWLIFYHHLYYGQKVESMLVLPSLSQDLPCGIPIVSCLFQKTGVGWDCLVVVHNDYVESDLYMSSTYQFRCS